MNPSAAENRFIIDKTAHEALALSSLIEKDCALYHQNTFHLVFDSQKNVVAANFLARKLIESLILDKPALLIRLASDVLNIKGNSEHITLWDPSKNSYLEFTATQFALMTALMSLPRTFLSGTSGYLVELLNWDLYFIFCSLIAIPALIILRRIKFIIKDEKI